MDLKRKCEIYRHKIVTNSKYIFKNRLHESVDIVPGKQATAHHEACNFL